MARQIAEAMASGSVEKLPRLTRHASPEFARNLLDAYYRLRDELEKMRADEGASWTLHERVAASVVAVSIDEAIRDSRAWLTACARRGGRGLRLVDLEASVPNGAGARGIHVATAQASDDGIRAMPGHLQEAIP